MPAPSTSQDLKDKNLAKNAPTGVNRAWTKTVEYDPHLAEYVRKNNAVQAAKRKKKAAHSPKDVSLEKQSINLEFGFASSPEEIGPWIANIRKAKGLKQKEVAKRLNWSPTTLSDIENGRSTPLPETIDKILTEGLELEMVIGAR